MSKRGITEAEKLLDAIGQLPEDMLEQALETEENETETKGLPQTEKAQTGDYRRACRCGSIMCGRFGETRPGFCAAAAKC